MAIIKCKMCGGDLILVEGQSVAECEYCGSRQTVPTADNEKKMVLFERAERLRKNCEFDKAAGIYETIVTEFRTESEAYWGLVLCKYGIEYVDDPATGKKIPTCHRSSFDSVMEDSDLEQALENADAIARKVYREEAKEFERIRKGIIEVSGKEQPYDIFICYKETDENGERTLDSVLAQDVYDALTDKGYRVFFSRITLEDKLGQEYEPYIFAALNSAKIMLVFGTDYEYFNAVWVKNEWSRYLKLMASDKSKHLIPCYKGIDAYDMPKEFAKLQAQDLEKVGALQDLLRGVEKIIQKKGEPAAAGQASFLQTSPNTASLLRRASLFLEDGKWDDADEYCEKVLDIDPENATAYLYKLMAQYEVHRREELKASEEPFDDSEHFEKILRFGSETLRAELTGYNDAVKAQQRRIEQERLEQEARQRQEQLEREERERQEQLERDERDERERQERLQWRSRYAPVQTMISAGAFHTVGLKSDGTVVAVGDNRHGRCDVSGWRDIVAVSAGWNHTVGLKSDGTVVTVGDNEHGRCDVSGWRDIVAVSAGWNHTVGLKSDGTVVAVGDNTLGKCDVSDWRDIVAVSAGSFHTDGLKSDGTVVAVGDNTHGKCDVSDWRDIVAVSAGYDHTVGLKADGTVVAVGDNDHGQCDVSGWRGIVAVSAIKYHTVGLKSDGTVVAVGNNENGQCDVSGWRDIVAVSAGCMHTVGLKSDGTVVAVGLNNGGQCDVSDWKLFQNLETIEEEREEARERRIAQLQQQRADVQSELANLKGLFTGKRRREIEARLTEIETELKGLR